MGNGQTVKVSVCIPAYKQVQYLKVLLDSISTQQFRDFEIVITDDSPHNEVENLLNTYYFNVPVKYVKNTEALGSPQNWNACIKMARGEYVKIMHHDDAFTGPDSLGKMVEVIENRKLDFLFSSTSIRNVKNSKDDRIHLVKKIKKTIRKPHLLFFGNSIGAPSTLLVKKEIADKLLFDRQYMWLVDVEYYYRLFKMASSGDSLDSPLILTHDAAEHQLTTRIMAEFHIQILEQAYFYEEVSKDVNHLTRFFMQVYFLRLVLRYDPMILDKFQYFTKMPRLVEIFSSHSGNSFLTQIFSIFIRGFDFFRKILVSINAL